GGQIAAFMGTAGDLAAHHKAGKLRVLVTSGAQRASQLPDVPTFRELKYDIEGAGWYAAYGHAAMPKEAIDRVSKAMSTALRSPDLKQRFDALGIVPTGHPPAELARIHKRDYELWGPVIRASGFKPEN
ncbi:MAG TPA: tripartite tricarboxylate transporter substrate-binding protein, partial [Burkholderiales bacterium]|nr:tripartite tricarboxylate transporter substrate-binding protein [Burkholderiales bacterium]